ncbi:MAG: hypothetical protein U0792_20245 [Gemmataceae bacterium]
MKLLTAVLPRGRILTENGWFTLAVCGFFVALEIGGRYAATTDFHDGLAGFVLLMGIATIAARHRRVPLHWLVGLGNRFSRLGSALASLRYDHGIDLRGTPPVTRRTPPAVWFIAFGLVAWSVLAALSWVVFPTGWRIVGFYMSYTLYLAFLMVLWGTLLTVTFVGVFVPVAVLDSLLKRWLGDTDRRGAELAAVVGYAVLVSAVASWVPPAAILVLCLVIAVGAWLVYLPRGADGAAVLWRTGPEERVYAVPLRRVLALVAMLASLLMFAILLTACGGRLFETPRPDDTMPVTALFGAIAAWLVPILVLVVASRLWSAARNDPARRTGPTAHITGEDRAAVRQAARIVKNWGYSVRLGSTPRERGHVGIVIVPPEQSEAKEFDPRWPLKVSIDDLLAGEVKQRARPPRRDPGAAATLPRLAETVQAGQRLQGAGRRWLLARSALVVRRRRWPRRFRRRE